MLIPWQMIWMNGPLEGDLVPRENSEKDEPHMAHAGIGHQPLEVGLGKGHHRPVEDTGHGQDHDGMGRKGGGARERGDGEAAKCRKRPS